MTGAVSLLARSYRVDVSTDNVNWIQVMGMNDLAPTIKPTMADSTDYNTNGWKSSEITLQDWKLVVKANRQATSGVEDQAFTMLRACIGQFGPAARIYVRWYRTDGINEAYSGWAVVEMTVSKTAVQDLNEWTITLTGDGVLNTIAVPSTSEPVPLITSITPAAAATGAECKINGSHFTGTTGITYNGTAVATADWTVVSDAVIAFVLPTSTSGTAYPVVVTNGSGPSASFSYTAG